MFDPIQFVNEIIVSLVILLVLGLLVRFRGRIMMALTGDDNVHCTSLDCLWWSIFQCCGTCTGDWTRCITRNCCCPARIRGINLLKLLGRSLGFTTSTVELKNIVVGDLPFPGRGDFFLMVECANNPPMTTSLAEEKLPKVVHFPEVITLRLRSSYLEKSVRISVRELNLFGSQELCCCYVSALSILDWSSHPTERMKRFELKPSEVGERLLTPPWILVEFDEPRESRDLENFHGNMNTVRTATRNSGPSYMDDSITDFKHKYVLLDSTGNAIQEPFEEDLQQIALLRRAVGAVTNCCGFWVFWFVAIYLVFRYYIYSCYHQYKNIAMAVNNNVTFPFSSHDLSQLVTWCREHVRGTGLRHVPCRPTLEQILQICIPEDEGGHFPPNQPPPLFLAGPLETISQGYLHNVGVPCFHGLCRFRARLREYDLDLLIAVIVLPLMVVTFRVCSDGFIRRRKASLQHRRSIELHKLKDGSGRSSSPLSSRLQS